MCSPRAIRATGAVYPPVSLPCYHLVRLGGPDPRWFLAWSLIYLFLNARKSLGAPRHPVAVGLTLATVGSAGLYGSEYLFLSSDDGDGSPAGA